MDENEYIEFGDDDCSEGFKLGDPGIYHLKVKEVRAKMSNKEKPQPMLNLRFISMVSGNDVCWDNLMLEGDGYGITCSKLKRFGLKKGDNGKYKFKPNDLLDKEIILTLKIKKDKDYGDKLVPDIKAETGGCGYQEVTKETLETVTEKDDIPF